MKTENRAFALKRKPTTANETDKPNISTLQLLLYCFHQHLSYYSKIKLSGEGKFLGEQIWLEILDPFKSVQVPNWNRATIL